MSLRKTKIYQLFLLSIFFLLPLWGFTQNLTSLEILHHAQFESRQNANYKKAVKLSLKALEKSPYNLDIQEFLGQCYLQLNQPTKARNTLLEVLKKDADRITARRYLVQLEIAENRYNSALHNLDKILKIQPKSKATWLKKAAVYRKLGRHKKAQNIIQRLTNIFPHDKKIQKFHQALLTDQAKYFLQQADPQKAIQKYKKAIKLAPANSDLYLMFINTLMQQDSLSTALKYSNKAQKHFPNDSLLFRKKISILQLMHRYQNAISLLEKHKSKQNKAQYEKVQNSLREESAHYHRYQDPFEIYEKVYATHPDNREVYHYLLNTSISRGYFPRALALINQGLRKNRKSKSLLLKKAHLFELMHNKERLKKTLAQLREWYPKAPEVIEKSSGYIYEKAKDYFQDKAYENARELFKKLIQHHGYKKEAQEYLFLIALEKQNFPQAKTHLQDLFHLYGEKPAYFLHRADLLRAEGKLDKAFTLLDSLQTVHPNKTVYKNYLKDFSRSSIRKEIQQKKYKKALSRTATLLKLDPKNKQGLQYQTNIYIVTHQLDKAKQSSEKNIAYHPKDQSLLLKRAAIHSKQDQPDQALAVYRKLYNQAPFNKKYKAALIEELQLKGLGEIKNKQWNKAKTNFEQILLLSPEDSLAVHKLVDLLIRTKEYQKAQLLINKRLQTAKNDNALRLKQGVIYKKQKKYESALAAYKSYQPSSFEQKAYIRNINQLRKKLLNNRVRVSYRHIKADSLFYVSSIGTVEYLRKIKQSTLRARLNYTSRQSGTGIQGEIDWRYTFKKGNGFKLNAGMADHFFPQVKAGASYFQPFGQTWEAELGGLYFYNNNRDEKFYFGIFQVKKYFGSLWFNTRLTFRTKHGFRQHFLLRSRFYLQDGGSYIGIMGGIGNIPESNQINYIAREVYYDKNVMVGAGFNYNLTYRTNIKLIFNWYAYKMGPQLYSNHYHTFISLSHRF